MKQPIKIAYSELTKTYYALTKYTLDNNGEIKDIEEKEDITEDLKKFMKIGRDGKLVGLDDILRLQEEALENIINSVSINNNSVNGSIILVKNPTNSSNRYYIKYFINEKQYNSDVLIDENEISLYSDKVKLFEKLYEKMGITIASEILKQQDTSKLI